MGLLNRPGDTLRSLSRVQRELILLVVGLILGFLLIPLLVWLVGTLMLGPYKGGSGSAGSLLSNLYKGLGEGAPSFWVVVLGPYALIMLARLLFGVALRFTRNTRPPENQGKRSPVKSSGAANPPKNVNGVAPRTRRL